MRERPTRDSVARDRFIQRIAELGHQVEPDRVIARDNVYRVDGKLHLMVRTSRLHQGRGVYFFGLTRRSFQNFAELPAAVIAFVLADTLEALMIPAEWIWHRREKLSADSKQFKLEIDKSLRLKLPKGSEGSADLAGFRERLELLDTSAGVVIPKREPKAVTDRHSDVQGMLLEIGNSRGFETYCPNKSPRFRSKSLGEIASSAVFPDFPGINNEIVRQIDVIWLERSFPVHAFEVEFTTGIWSGLVRLGELRRLNTVFHVITDGDGKAFRRRIAGDIFTDLVERCHHANATDVRELYEAELITSSLRKKLFV